MSMLVAIHTEPGDVHAIAAACVLRGRGHEVVRCIGDEFPRRERMSLRVHAGDPGTCSLAWTQAGGGAHDPRDCDAVWYRRPRPVVLPDEVHAADREYAYNECWELYQGMAFAPRAAFWVNPPASHALAGNKPLQLQVATGLGVRVPATLVSNEPEDVRAFVAERGRVVYKPMRGATWQVGGEVHGTYTTPVTPADLPSDRMIQACPGIYQDLVEKRFEVRAQFFGRTCLAIAIDSTRMEYGRYDWRRHQRTCDPHATPVELPAEVRNTCLRMMAALGIVSGAFDFIVDESGEWVFLEVNPVGQFAFIERWCPQLPVLATFCDFLESRDPDFLSAGSSRPARLADVMASGDFKAMAAHERSTCPQGAGRRSVVEEC